MLKLIAGATISLATAVAAAQTVTVTLDSPQDGQTIAAGSTIDWSISFAVSAADNQGLALLSTDLVQDPANPALFDLPPADGVPSDMTNFSRPAGVSNPGETDPTTGYIGVQRGTAGQKNLIQIGGGQHTFGVPRSPGSGVAENANVIAGVGQSGAVVLASGSFTAPSECGTYAFRLENTVANVVVQRNDPPAFSPVASATVVVSDGTITISVGVVGDIDGNGVVDLGDLAIMLSQFGMSGKLSADLNGNGVVDLGDLAILLSAWGTSCG